MHCRVPRAEFGGLPELVIEGLDDDDARALLASAVVGPLDERVRDRIVAPGLVASQAGDYGAWAVANVHLRARPVEAFQAPPAWDNVFRDSPSLGYVSATHQRGRPGKLIARCVTSFRLMTCSVGPCCASPIPAAMPMFSCLMMAAPLGRGPDWYTALIL